MLISTKGRYALRVMIDLAEHQSEEFISLKEIAQRQEISDKDLEQIVTLLARAGYVKSMRGAQGGYKLAFSPEEYTVGMILRVTEGNLAPVACLEDATNQCERSQCCATLSVWEKLDKAINDVVDHITLADLVEEQKAMPDYNLM